MIYGPKHYELTDLSTTNYSHQDSVFSISVVKPYCTTQPIPARVTEP